MGATRGDDSVRGGSGYVESQRWFGEHGSVGSVVRARFGQVGGVVGALGEGCWLEWVLEVSRGILGGGRVGSIVGQ